eukprot:283792-Pelagomonas_calceolata.AAC.3
MPNWVEVLVGWSMSKDAEKRRTLLWREPHKGMHVRAHAYGHTCVQTQAHAHMHADTIAYGRTCMQTQAHTLIYMQTRAHFHSHACMLKCMRQSASRSALCAS